MNSRDAVLKALRSRTLPVPALPALQADFLHYDNIEAAFVQAVERAAGTVVRPQTSDDPRETLLALDVVQRSRAICSLVPELNGNVPVTGNARSFEHVDLLVLRAEFGVAENGALWLTDSAVRQRSVFFLAEHVVALLAPQALVHTMHEAYQRIQVRARPFGCFVSGPSKTADIEQALVVGAHGPRSLSVLLA